MEALFNYLFLNTDSLIPIPIYNNDNGLLREFLSDKKDAKNTSDMILWRVNVKKKDIKSVPLAKIELTFQLVKTFGKDFELHQREDTIDTLWNGSTTIFGIKRRFEHRNVDDKYFHSIPVLAGGPEFLDEIERSLRHCINESDKKIYRSGLISNP
ncbi:hypothetical protein GLOIN_2v1773659 [Rhizophagus irregularis DAOM 181602=DAOM 197198]|uniref:Uncharacterized protein n=1 Tax=Rhizophagus irregularis (strain DAOM 181602 / DAOM 197198 / MUCL 43194) TaxID=747089 RepID=A0A2P4Q4B5_RHIID|nr:hypothetical protein GLOIN_2v1773659 [Rhizophagus irregularis DAOM 181602=DAOM 197198]POG72493.1 hypothetical protein GLOIN_2v1773659 [Rhizophagus irregularis DAOM 181602=DAOM 197198]|eukprot:XP_025179359.1 hypothetical protein GLOIN_2v1773659 [Rhizophagus irregularis DAOM 181602=DAOM 197198]